MEEDLNFPLFNKLKELGKLFNSYSSFLKYMYGYHSMYLAGRETGEIKEDTFIRFISSKVNSRINHFSYENSYAKLFGGPIKIVESEVYLVDKTLKYYRRSVLDFMEILFQDCGAEFSHLEHCLQQEQHSLMDRDGIGSMEAMQMAQEKFIDEIDRVSFLRDSVEPFLSYLKATLENEIDHINMVYRPVLESISEDIVIGSIGAERLRVLMELPDNEVKLVLSQAYQGLNNTLREDKLSQSAWTVTQIAILFTTLKEENIISGNISKQELSGLISQLTTYKPSVINKHLTQVQRIMTEHKHDETGYDAEYVALELMKLSEKIRLDKIGYIERELSDRQKGKT